MLTSDSREPFRFGDFELDVAAYELRRDGRPIRLERQPMDVLIMLVERRGQLVSRSDIVERLWGKDVFVDVDTGVNTAIRKIRHALRDSREEPAFIETVSGKGYRLHLGQAYEQAGETDLALEALTDATRLSSDNSKPISLRGYLLAKSGRVNDAQEVLRRLESLSRDRYVPPYAMALVHAGLGEREAVFEWLDKAYAARDVHLIFLPVDPKWDPYRSDPRFKALLGRCGFD